MKEIDLTLVIPMLVEKICETSNRNDNAAMVECFAPKSIFDHASGSEAFVVWHKKPNRLQDGRAKLILCTKKVQFVANAASWRTLLPTLDIVSALWITTIYWALGMWKSVLTFGLLSLTVTGLTLFNVMTWHFIRRFDTRLLLYWDCYKCLIVLCLFTVLNLGWASCF